LASGTTPGRDLERAVAARCRRDRAALVEPLAPAIVAALIPRGGAVAGGAGSRMSPPWAALAGDPEARNSVARTAAMVGLSERQLRRRCRTAFGYGPKTLARILRLRHAVGLARAGVPFVVVAGLAGYADQAHLAREVRALAGVPLGGLLGATSPDAAGSAATSPPAA
jgi:AraC-like DNA-binding protein